jgi:hypothetical protein
VRVEVVAVRAEDAGAGVGRVGDLDLDAGQAALEEPLEELGAGRLGGRHALVVRALAAGERRLDHAVLVVAVDEVVVVVAGEEDEAPAPQPLRDQRQQAGGGVDRVGDRAEEEVEEVTEQDHLVDPVEGGGQPIEEELLAEQVAAGPGAEVRVGDG